VSATTKLINCSTSVLLLGNNLVVSVAKGFNVLDGETTVSNSIVAFGDSFQDDIQCISLSIVYWNTFSYPLASSNVPVVSITLHSENTSEIPLSNLSNSVLYTVPISSACSTKIKSTRNPPYTCVYWDGAQFSPTGCIVKYHDNTKITCECTHLTDFSVLLSSNNCGDSETIAVGVSVGVFCFFVLLAILGIMLYAYYKRKGRIAFYKEKARVLRESSDNFKL